MDTKREGFTNPKGWDEVDGVKLPSVETWADLSEVERKKVVSDVILQGARP